MTTYRYIDKTIQQQGQGGDFAKIINKKKNHIIELQKIKRNMLQK